MNFVTGGEGAGGFLGDEGVAVSLRQLDIRDDVLGGNPAGEAAVETGRGWVLDKPGTRESCENSMFSSGSVGGERARGCRTAVGLSVASAEGAWLARKVPG